MNRPNCEHKGSTPHKATHVCAWELSSGRTWRFSCEQHKEQFGKKPYFAAKLEGVVNATSEEGK